MKDLAGAGISLDKSWILMFKEKAGQSMHRSRSLRDCELECPDQMICRWMPETACGLSTTEAASLKVAISKVAARDHVFKNSPILRDGRTEVATQVSAKDLLVIETADDTNPDNCLSEDDPIQGGKKVEQIGCNACEKILNGMLDGHADDWAGFRVRHRPSYDGWKHVRSFREAPVEI